MDEVQFRANALLRLKHFIGSDQGFSRMLRFYLVCFEICEGSDRNAHIIDSVDVSF